MYHAYTDSSCIYWPGLLERWKTALFNLHLALIHSIWTYYISLLSMYLFLRFPFPRWMTNQGWDAFSKMVCQSFSICHSRFIFSFCLLCLAFCFPASLPVGKNHGNQNREKRIQNINCCATTWPLSWQAVIFNNLTPPHKMSFAKILASPTSKAPCSCLFKQDKEKFSTVVSSLQFKPFFGYLILSIPL